MILNDNIPQIKVVGFKSEIKDVSTTLKLINELNDNDSNFTVQLLDARGIADEKHILNATIHAINAFKRKNNIAKDLGMEICLRASAQRQISRAIEILGLKVGPMDICAVLVGCNYDETDESNECSSSIDIAQRIENKLNEMFTRDDSVLEANEQVLKEIYNIENEEMEVLGSVIYTLIERTTILILDA
ncbi:MAG: KEOPS complex subunit Cgi121 [Methanobacteriaceae archaeon]|nr:KEOPS complex subunit Cgi121 [Methanobacteriaceae archaeon]MDP2836048.1 KEOPS complex subunit Cgi121 [Methanobacteriaceae archaeon]MDP3035204.1 KEOPS complex subunit Cgi121 [Methanobacteriaceae archaeon]MDP3485411.1 KEOPS complex subunit Cgi121 [Methanobacteriaceae archaeon]MDP3623144.1 KEOPS complex subunit Cgi121 [Methanobacteriaceae archaeon]